MEFRPCIDIHNGKVKQIVGSSLADAGDYARENFVSQRDAADYARLYQADGLRGGHVIMLNAVGSAYYEVTKAQALAALRAYSGGLMAGGGITAENASEFLDAGASHVIVTSYVFRDGRVDYERLQHLVDAVGREHLVLDLSCRRRGAFHSDDPYYIVTDRWQKFTDERISMELLDRLSAFCSEFLIHAVDVEGKSNGIEKDLVRLLGAWCAGDDIEGSRIQGTYSGIPITYAGGIHSFDDLDELRTYGHGRIHATIGSALDLFGGKLSYREVCGYCKK